MVFQGAQQVGHLQTVSVADVLSKAQRTHSMAHAARRQVVLRFAAQLTQATAPLAVRHADAVRAAIRALRAVRRRGRAACAQALLCRRCAGDNELGVRRRGCGQLAEVQWD